MNKYLIAGGNSTILIKNPPKEQNKRITLARELLEEVEQVGFIEQSADLIPQMSMMGNELSINGTLAFAKYLGNSGYLRTSGTTSLIKYENKSEATTIELKLPFKKNGEVILFEGIGYLVSNTQIPTKNNLKALAERYELPAFGQIEYRQNTITPFVYVKDTDSLVKESACGSGSIAFALKTNQRKIRQTTGGYIVIEQKNKLFKISSEVTIIPI